MPKKKIKRVRSLELNMRKGPGTDNPIIRVLEQHTEVELLGQDEEVDNGSWVKIQVGHNMGWVNQRYLDLYPQKTTRKPMPNLFSSSLTTQNTRSRGRYFYE